MTKSIPDPRADKDSKLMVADVNELGMPLKRYKWKDCYATVAEGDGWATVYDVWSGNEGKGEAQELLGLLKHLYRNTRFGITVALNDRMKHIIEKLGIEEYEQPNDR